MYLSHPVRRMRASPTDDDASLVVELDSDADEAPLHRAVEDAGGSVERDLGFDCWLVTVPESGVDALCDLDAVVRIETAATLDVGVDDDSTKPDS